MQYSQLIPEKALHTVLVYSHRKTGNGKCLTCLFCDISSGLVKKKESILYQDEEVNGVFV